jgi:hypothetical protein
MKQIRFQSVGVLAPSSIDTKNLLAAGTRPAQCTALAIHPIALARLHTPLLRRPKSGFATPCPNLISPL